MKLYPTEMRRTGSGRYRVTIETASPDAVREFDFVVTGEEIRVVESSVEFEQFVGHNGGPVRSLFAAILAFDTSQGIDIAG